MDWLVNSRLMLVPGKHVCFLLVIGSLVFNSGAEPLRLVSVPDPTLHPPPGGGGDSITPIMSPDGRFVFFASTANNLVLGTATNSVPGLPTGRLNVFLRDRSTLQTTLVSVNSAGTAGGNGDSIPTGISTNGRYALFESSASDLISSDTNGVTDVFIRDLANNTTVLVSVNTNGEPANGVCRGSTLTPDGRFVAFVSAASNLVPGDTNRIPDVFVRDLISGVTTLVSVGAQATNVCGLTGSEAPDITPDGRYVAFYTTATNLVPGVTTGGEIYLRDLVANTTTWVSGGARAFLGYTNAVFFNHTLSADGQYVAFEGCTNPPPVSANAAGVILRFSRTTGLTDLVHTNAYVQTANVEEIRSLDMTPDGRFIAFVARTNTAGTTCIELWDAQSGLVTLVSGDPSGNVTTNTTCDWPMLDESGRFVAFLSTAPNLVTNSLAGDNHLYVRDVVAGTTVLVDADTNGVGSPLSPAAVPRLSADGRLVLFECADANLVSDDRNHAADIFLRDLVASTNELISAHDASLPCLSANGPTALSTLAVSATIRWIAFTSDADNLTPHDTNGFRDVFVRDLLLGTNFLVSVATNGAGADGISTEPTLSADGRYVAFTSSADNLVRGDANRSQDVFLRDLQTGVTSLVSVRIINNASANGASYSPIISSNGRFVLFRSLATDLGAGLSGTYENLFLRDFQTGSTRVLTTRGLVTASMTLDGSLVAFADIAGAAAGKIYVWDSLAGARIETNSTVGGISTVSISPNGARITCFTGSGTLAVLDRVARTNGVVGSCFPAARPGLRFSADGRLLAYAAAAVTNGTNQVYLYDLQTQTRFLVSSRANSSVGANGNSESPELSPDGRFLTFRSVATDLLAAGAGNAVPELFLYDRVAGSITLLTASDASGAPADNRSLTPAFSADGRSLLFQSWAADLVSGDFNQSEDVLVLTFLYATVLPASTPGVGPTLSWSTRPGEAYHVQYKETLTDPVWQEVSGVVTVVGSQAQLTDLAPGAGQRFYRVVAF
jgi:Tol biopolymer transport system component